MKRIFTLFISLFFIFQLSQAQPTTQASGIVILPASPTSLRFNWTAGNAANRVLVIVRNSTSTYSPLDAVNPVVAGTAFPSDGGAADLDPASGKIAAAVFANTGTTVTVTGLAANTTYSVQILEYTGTGATLAYNRSGQARNPLFFTFYTSNGSWVTPTSIAGATVQAWGAGGGSGGNTSTSDGSVNGGGGGAYASSNLTTLTGSYAITVGGGGAGTITQNASGATGGDSSFGTLVVAAGGTGGSGNTTAGAGGTTAASTGTVKFAGGTGGTRVTGGSGGGGGGGGSAGTTANGGNGGNASGGTGGTAGTAGANGGAAGGAGGANNGTGNNGSFPGGGAGGQGNSGGAATNGAAGLVIVSYTIPTAQIVRQTPTSQLTNASSVTFRVTFSENVSNVTATGDDFAVSGTATSTALSVNTITASTVYDVVVTGVSGNGNLNLDFAAGQDIASTATGNLFTNIISSEQEYTIDTTPPTLSIGAPSITTANGSSTATFAITYTGANTVNLTNANVSIVDGGSGANATINVTNGTTTTPTVTLTGFTGTGTVAISIAANTAADNAGNNALGAGPSANITVDANPPAAFSTGDVTTNSGGTVVAGYYNISNTNGITIDVPISATDASLESGTVQIQVSNNGPAGAFVDLGTISTTLLAELGTTKSINITNAILTANSKYADGNTLHFRAILKDAAGNATTGAVSSTMLIIDKTAPVLTLTKPVASSFATNAQVSYTRSENLSSGTITWAYVSGTADSNHPQSLAGAELTANQTNYTLTNNPTLVDGAVYNVSFAGTDVAGNTATVVTNNAVTIDNGAPAAFTTGNVTTNAGGTVVAGYYNISNTSGITVQVPVASGDASLENGSIQIQVSNNGAAGSFIDITGAAAAILLADLGTTKNLSISNTLLTANSKYADGNTLHFRAVITDAAGNATIGSTSSTSLIIDKTAPTASIAAPSATIARNASSVTYSVTYTGAASYNLTAATVNGSGASASATVTNGTTSTATVTLTNFTGNGTVSITLPAGAASDAAGNATAITGPSAAITVDNTSPATGTVGTLTPLNGRVVSTYFNGTNTKLRVVVPMANDASLDGGSIQIKIRMNQTGAEAYVDVPNSGLSIITNAERTALSKTMDVDVSDLLTAGMTDGNFGGLRSAENKFLQVTAASSDLAGNTSADYTAGATLDVDRTAPTVNSSVVLVPATGAKDVIEFTMSETLSDHSTTPVERANNFQFIAADNNYGGNGFSIGPDDSRGITNNARYIYQGATNTAVPAFVNTRLIYIDSKTNGATWASGVTTVRYKTGGSGSTANFVVRDPAGNELADTEITTTAGPTTTLSAATGAAAGPNLINSSTLQPVFGFALTSNSNTSITALSIATTANPAGLLKNFKLYSNTTNTFSGATNLGLTVSTTASSIDFNSISLAFTANTTRYFYLVADVEDYFYSSNPTIGFSIASSSLPNAGGGFTVNGGYAGSTQTGTTYTLKDNTAPAIVSITNNVNPIKLGALTQTVVIKFNEPMNNGTTPAVGSITVSGATNWGAFTGGVWSTGTLTNDTYTVSLTHNGTAQTSNETSSIAVASGIKDWGGNDQPTGTSSSFSIDTRRPLVSAITTSLSTVNVSNPTVRVFVTYDETMNPSSAPTITFSNGTFGSATPVNTGGYTNGWNAANTVYAIDYTNSTTTEEFGAVTVSANGAQDAVGNTQTTLGTSAASFILDTKRPTVFSINRVSGQYTNGSQVSYSVTFTEAVSNVNENDFTPVNINGTVSTGNVKVGSIATLNSITYTLVVENLTGDGDVRLDVNGSTATINDTHGNALNANKTGDQIYTIDHTAPSISSIAISSPTVTWNSVNVNGTSLANLSWAVTFNENVTGVDFSDFVVTKNSLISNSALISTDVTGSGQNWTVTVRNVALTSTTADAFIRIDMEDDDSILDAAGNPLGGVGSASLPTSYTGNYFYTIRYPEPAEIGQTFNVTAVTSTSFTVNWVSPTSPTRLINYYFIDIKESSVATFNTLVDGVYSPESDLSDGRATYAYSAFTPGSFSRNIASLKSGVTYDVRISSATYSGYVNTPFQYQFDYLTSTTLNGQGTTLTAPSATIVSSNVSSTISSTVDDIPAGQSEDIATFTIDDDGAAAMGGTDNAPFKFTTLYITPGTSNAITNWTQAIAGAELTTPSGGTWPGVIEFNTLLSGKSSIKFIGFNSAAPTDFGYIDANQAKTYTLRIWLKSSLGGSLPTTIDGQKFEFIMDGSYFTLDNGNSRNSSQFYLPQSASSSAVTVDVPTEGFNFITQPVPTNHLVLKNFTTVPQATAVDHNNNRDLGFSGTANNVSVTNAGSIPMNPGNTTSLTLTPSLGVITFPSNFQYTGAGDGTLTITKGAINSNTSTTTTGSVACSTVIVNYSNLSTISGGSGITRVLSTVVNSPGISVFNFTYNDDGGVGLGDGADTKISEIVITPDAANQLDWAIVLAGATLSDGVNTIAASSITTSGIKFNGATFTGSTLSTVTDGVFSASKTYTLNVWFKTSLGTLAATADQNRLVFYMSTASPANITLAATGSQAPSATGVSSGTGNGLFEVDATLLEFTTDFSGVLASSPVPPPSNAGINFLVNTSSATQSFSNPVVQAIDIYGNRDTNFNAGVTVTAAGGMSLSNPLTSLASGVGTFPSTFAYNAVGNGELTVSTSTTNRVGGSLVSTVNSNEQDVTVKTGTATKINSPAIAAATVSSITNTSSGSTVFTFSITDDPSGTPVLQDDGNPTKITDLIISRSSLNNTINDWSQAIAGARLEDASNAASFIDLTVADIGVSTLTFNSIPFASGQLGEIADNATKTYNLKIWLKTNLSGSENYNTTIDGLKFGFDVISANVSTDNTGTSLLSGLNANTTNVTSTVTVIATKIDFTTVPATASINTPFTVVAEARDANNNLDLGYNGTPSFPGLHPNGNTSDYSIANPPTGNFISGILNYPSNFQFTSGTSNTQLVLDGTGGITGISSVINVTTSFDSRLLFDAAYTFQPNIRYIDYQAASIDESTPSTIPNSSYEVARFVVQDGNPALPYAGKADIDGAPTVLQSFDVELYTTSGRLPIRKIAIYDGTTELMEKNPGALSGGKSVTSFNGVNITAADEGSKSIKIYVSFLNTDADILDNDPITLRISSATNGAGSQFINTPGYIGGVNGGLQTPATVAGVVPNKIEVEATRLDFTTQPALPSAIAGINEPVSPPVVEARDINAIVDLDYDNSNPDVNYRTATLTSAAALSMSSFPFTLGKLNFPSVPLNGPLAGSLYYTDTGNGKITATANGLSSNTNGSIASGNVSVMHVSAVIATGGVLTSNNIKGGTAGAVMFGVTFQPQGQTSTEPSLNGFSFLFDHFYKTGSTTILKNFKVYESTSGNFNSSTDVAISYSATVAQTFSSLGSASNLDMVTVTFPTPRTLYQGITRSYFLVADVDITANITTQNLTPQLIDKGYGYNTNSNILTTKGSSDGTVIGQTYKFASTRPPQLISSVPFNGQLNVDPALQYIDLTFDVNVLTYDSSALLYDRQNNVLIAKLKAINGLYDPNSNLSNVTTNPLRFEVQLLPGKSLKRDSVYYVTIAKGSFNTGSNTGTGISDDGLNFYGGISYNGTLYFKISSPNAPKLVSTNSSNFFASKTAATFNTSFDIPGIAHYLVTAPGVYTNSTISNTIIKNGTGGVAFGSYAIEQLSTNAQSATFTADLSGYATYDVWIYAENDALPLALRVSTANPYGGFIAGPDPNNYQIIGSGGVGPTLRLTVDTQLNYSPNYQICANSTNLLTDAIIIGESAKGDFSGGVQDFNILLPTNFLFDITHMPTVTVTGNDFNLIPVDNTLVTLTYINSSILNIKVNNSGSTDFDNIIVSNMKIKASNAASGKIKRFAGSGLSSIPVDLASISSSLPQISPFTNTYNDSNNFISFGITDVVNYIPDNFNTPISTVRLIPPATPNDYGSSFFSGPGVTNDILSLNGVTLNAAFDITMTHTDMNGCVTQKTEQFTIYDHTKAIPVLGTQQCITNPNFPADYTGVYPSPTLKYTDIAGYSLIQLYANIPSKVLSGQVTQIISGNAWQTLIQSIPVQGTTGHPGPSGLTFYDYSWDYSKILNAASLDPSITTKPYDNFQGGSGQGTPNGKHYWNGGSLGIVEFTGKFQSNADYSLFVPFRQEVEIFVPAIPVIEVSTPSQTASDGTAIYCEAGGAITINGYPAASAGSSTGTFKIVDVLSNLVIQAPAPNSAFVDNGNGTATILPSLLNNSYKPIKIIYTYKDNKSPCESSTTFNIQITPNPVANFTMESVISNNSPSVGAYCENNPITFTSTSTIATGTINVFDWYFDDANNSGANPNSSAQEIAKHYYSQTLAYNPRLIVTSSYGCASPSKSIPLKVGVVPSVKFGFEGVSTADPINFTNGTKIDAGAVSDGIAKLDWNYGDGTSFNGNLSAANAVSHIYANPNPYSVDLKITSNLGCVNNLKQSIVVLPKSTPVDANAYNENFESSNGDWQVWNTGTSTTPISWAYGTPSTKVIVPDPAINGSKIWKTNLTGNYNGNERSALYSPSFDLRKLKRPMISFSSFVQMESSDGVVIQYSVDNKNITDVSKEWIALGDIGDGVDWFTNQGIAAKPGDQSTKDLGWTNQDKTKWLTSKHSLALVQNAPQVVFRFALGSVKPEVQFEGFAIDNVRIGERTRTVLFESFANTSNPNGQEKIQNEAINAYSAAAIGTEVVKVNYHVGFPASDPFNTDNPADPSARALYYNVTSTPITRIDGTKDEQDRLFKDWGNSSFEVRSLQLSQADLTINSEVKTDGTISVEVKVNAVVDLPENTILHVAMVEQSIAASVFGNGIIQTGETNFEYVLKKMLPTAAGTRFGKILQSGNTNTFGPFEWTPDSKKLYPQPNDLAVIVFLQNETTKEIYQSDLVKNLSDPPSITGLGDINGEDIIVYPNPADRAFTIQLPGATQKGISVQVVNQLGQFVHQTTFSVGEQKKEINTESLAEGLYIIQLGEGETAVRKKVIVTHK